jgi:hypothetical protein
LSSVGNGTATITFPALAENTTFWLLIECPLAVTVDPAYVYNTDETVIGQWIDGKPIYRKVYTNLSFNSSKMVSISLTTLNVDKIIRCDGWITRDGYANIYPISHPQEMVQYTKNVAVDSSFNLTVTLGSGYSDVSVFKISHLIFEYTKTTD